LNPAHRLAAGLLAAALSVTAVAVESLVTDLAAAPAPAPVVAPVTTALSAVERPASDSPVFGGYTYVHPPFPLISLRRSFAFDRGLTMFFAYQPDEAEQAFRQAARLDPALAMAWWGVGLGVGSNQ
jgi:hypothetical protein